MSDQTGPDGEWPEADIDERLAEVAELFGTDGPPDLDDIAGPVHWPDVAAVDATQEWESLRRWVDQLIGRFAHLDHHVIPLCWWRHNGHVEALAALRDHERVCYAESSPATAAVDWHRAFRDIEARLREWTGILVLRINPRPPTATRTCRRRRRMGPFRRRRRRRSQSSRPRPRPQRRMTPSRSLTRAVVRGGSRPVAVKTKWPVRHRCGHQVDWDLSRKLPAKRAGFAHWLAQRDCTRCWWAKRRMPDRKDRAIWRAQRAAQATAAIGEWETSAQMPPLQGSDKAVAWATRVRHHLVTAAYQSHRVDDDIARADRAAQLERSARRVTCAAWWIDQRESDPAALAALLANMLTAAPESNRHGSD